MFKIKYAALGAPVLFLTPLHAQEVEPVQEKSETGLPSLMVQVPPPAPPVFDAHKFLPELPEGANVVFLRENAQPTAWGATIKIDGKKLVSIGNKRWTATTLAPGTYEIATSWSFMSGQKGGKYKLTVKEGRTHFLEIVGTSQVAGYGAGLMFQVGSGIGEIYANDRTAARISNCCSYKPAGD